MFQGLSHTFSGTYTELCEAFRPSYHLTNVMKVAEIRQTPVTR